MCNCLLRLRAKTESLYPRANKHCVLGVIKHTQCLCVQTLLRARARAHTHTLCLFLSFSLSLSVIFSWNSNGFRRPNVSSPAEQTVLGSRGWWALGKYSRERRCVCDIYIYTYIYLCISRTIYTSIIFSRNIHRVSLRICLRVCVLNQPYSCLSIYLSIYLSILCPQTHTQSHTHTHMHACLHAYIKIQYISLHFSYLFFLFFSSVLLIYARYHEILCIICTYMYVSMYIYVQICMYIHTCVCMCVYMGAFFTTEEGRYSIFFVRVR